MGPEIGRTVGLFEQEGGTSAGLDGAIDLTRRWHASKGIEEMKGPAEIFLGFQRKCCGHHAPAPPHTAFDDVAGYLVFGDVTHSVAKRRDPLAACHYERSHSLDDLRNPRFNTRKPAWL